MRRLPVFRLTLISLSIVSLAACQSMDRSDGAPARIMALGPINYVLDDCAPGITSNVTIRVHVDNGVDFILNGRSKGVVTTEVSNGAPADDDNDRTTDPDNGPGDNIVNRNRYHFDIGGAAKLGHLTPDMNQYVGVRFVLKDKVFGWKFYDSPDLGYKGRRKSPLRYIFTDNKETYADSCFAKFSDSPDINTGLGVEVVEIYVKYRGAIAPTRYENYNFGLISNDSNNSPETPVYIDPKGLNSG